MMTDRLIAIMAQDSKAKRIVVGNKPAINVFISLGCSMANSAAIYVVNTKKVALFFSATCTFASIVIKYFDPLFMFPAPTC